MLRETGFQKVVVARNFCSVRCLWLFPQILDPALDFVMKIKYS
jgi:hypothetical protein